MNGRNFLDLALLVPGVSPTNIPSTQLFAETSAVPGDGLSVGSQRNLSNSFIVDGVSANDDAAGLSGDPATAVERSSSSRSSPRAGRPSSAARSAATSTSSPAAAPTRCTAIGLLVLARRRAERGQRAARARRCRCTSSSTARASAGRSRRTARSSSRTSSSATSTSRASTTITDANVAVINARLAAVGYPGSPVTTGVYPNPVRRRRTGLGQAGSPARGSDQLERALQPLPRGRRRTRAAPAGSTAPSASAGARQRRPRGRLQQHAGCCRAAPSTRRARSSTLRRPEGAADRSGRPGGEHRRRRVVRHGFGQPDRGAPTRCSRWSTTLSHQAGAHALRAGVDFLYNDDTHHVSALDARLVHVLVDGELPGRPLQQRRVHPDLRRSGGRRRRNPNLGLYVQDEWHARARA